MRKFIHKETGPKKRWYEPVNSGNYTMPYIFYSLADDLMAEGFSDREICKELRINQAILNEIFDFWAIQAD